MSRAAAIPEPKDRRRLGTLKVVLTVLAIAFEAPAVVSQWLPSPTYAMLASLGLATAEGGPARG